MRFYAPMIIDVPEGQPADLDGEALLRAVQTDAQDVLITLAEQFAVLLGVRAESFSATFQLERIDPEAAFHVGETTVWWITVRLRDDSWSAAKLDLLGTFLAATGAPFQQVDDRVSPRRVVFTVSYPQPS